jgi:uncharacterized protein with PQ loop repeat
MFTAILDLTAPLQGFTSQLALVAAVYGVIGAFSPTLQIVKMRRAGSSESLSRGYIGISVGGYLIWFMYGLAMHNVPLIVCDSIGIMMQTLVLFWAHRLRPSGAAAAEA